MFPSNEVNVVPASSKFLRLSIKARLVLTVAVLVVVSLVVVSTFNFLSLRSTTRASVNASAQSLALARAEGIGQWVASKSAVVGALLPATQVEDPMPALTQAVRSGFFDTTYIGYQEKRRSSRARRTYRPTGTRPDGPGTCRRPMARAWC